MHILLLANYSETSLSGYAYRALKQLGHQVTFASPQHGLEEMVPCHSLLDVPQFLDEHQLHPDLILVVESSVHPLLVPLNIEKVRCVTAWWAIDNHINYRWHKEFAALVDYTFFAQKDFTIPASAYINKKIHWLPLACDPDIHKNKYLERTVDCGFVGNMNKYRQSYFNKLKKQTNIEIVNGLNPDQMSDYYNTCKTVFNISMRGDLNMRTFEAMACGSLLITQDIQNGLRDLFEPGKHIGIHHLKDAAKVIEYYKTHPDEAKKIAQAGHELVVAEHTYAKRMETLIHIANGKIPAFSEAIYAVRKHYMFRHRHFKKETQLIPDTIYHQLSIWKKIMHRYKYLSAYIRQKVYLMQIKKFG